MNEPARSPSILDDLRQSEPFRSPAQAVMASLARTADDVRHRLTEVLAPAGLSLEQFNIIWILRDAGRDGLPTLEVADRMVRRNPGVTRLIDRLIEKGLVTRHRSTEDRRRVFCKVTEAGLRTVESFEPLVRQAADTMSEALDGEELRALGDYLDRLRVHVNLEQD